jgi:hypothetical protein
MKSLLYHGFGIKGYRYRRTRYEKGRSSSSWSRALPDEEADTSWISVAGCAHGGHRAETRGVEGQGTAMVEHDDGGGIRAVPPFVEAYTKITRPLGRLIVDLARFMTLADIAGWLLLSWDTVKTVVQRRLEKITGASVTGRFAPSP